MEAIQILSALLAPIIAIVGGCIGVFQWRLARLTFRQKLFEDRLKIYKAVQKYLSEFIQHTKVSGETHWELVDALQRSRFLLPIEISTQVKEIFEQGNAAMASRTIMENPSSLEYQPAVDKHHKQLLWLNTQLENLHETFLPAMDLRSDL